MSGCLAFGCRLVSLFWIIFYLKYTLFSEYLVFEGIDQFLDIFCLFWPKVHLNKFKLFFVFLFRLKYKRLIGN